MPKGFSEREREFIRARLLEHGRALLATTGVRKTSVEDLTTAAGISKGAFYLFYPSKEELFFSIFEQFEADYQRELLDYAGAAEGPARAQVEGFLARAFSLWKSSPLFRHFGREDLEQLTRRLPPERVEQNTRSDESFVAQLLDLWRSRGIAINADAQHFTGLMRALFFVSAHEADIGAAYAATINLLMTLVAGHLAASAPEKEDQ
jgi:AcrR family transcriptional regulator